MRVAIDLTSLAFNFSGIERYALNITKNIVSQDKNNQYELIFCNEVFPDLRDEAKEENVNCHVLQSKPGKINKLILFQIKLVSYINRINPDCVIFPAFAAPIMMKRNNMIDTFHDLGYFDCPQMWKWYISLYGQLKLKSSIKHSTAFVAVSDYTKERMVDFFHINESLIYVAKNAVDSRFFDSLVPRNTMDRLIEKYHLPKEKFFMCLATLEPRKNLRLLVEAYSKLVLSGTTNKMLVLAGRKGWKIDDLLSGLDACVRNRITVTGFIDDEDLPMIYKMADVFVFPSKYEGFGIPPLEAIACGTQAIVSDIPVFKEAFGDAVTYFRNNDKDDLQDKLMDYRCIEKEVMLEQVRKYDWIRSAQVYIQLVNDISGKQA